MIPKGRIKYVPPVVLEEVDSIKKYLNIQRDSEAFKELTNYARIGREMERIGKFWGVKRRK